MNCGHGRLPEDCEVCKAPLPPDAFALEMKRIAETLDTERAHIEMDRLLADILRKFGYDEGIEIYEKRRKWYA